MIKQISMKSNKYFSRILLILTISTVSCVDNNDSPPPVVEFIHHNPITVQQIKDLYAGQLALDYQLRFPVEIVNEWALRGIITASDKKDGNLYKEAFIQDATGGLRLLFESTSGLYIGDSVIVNVKGLYIGDYGDFWQVGGEPYVDASGSIRVSGMNMDKQVLKLSINNPTDPDTITITQAKSATYLGKLVTLKDVQFADDAVNKTYGDLSGDVPASANRDLMDCNKKKIIVRSSGYASFAGDTITDLKGILTGIVTKFSSDYQLIIRDFKEVKLTDDRCMPGVPDLGAPVETISENFSGFSNNAEVLVTGWQNIAQYGDRNWQAKYFSGNTYAQATGYNSNLASMVTWLITRPVTISTQKVLSFQTAQAYWTHTGTHQPFQVFYSTNYTGKNLLTAIWVPITATLPSKTDTNYAFINSGNINLPVEDGKSCVIAFKYTGSDTESTSICLDNIIVTTSK
jgi:hypothetical protein